MNPVHGRAISAILTRLAALLLLCTTTTLHADVPKRIFPFIFFEGGNGSRSSVVCNCQQSRTTDPASAKKTRLSAGWKTLFSVGGALRTVQ
jgi:uncharacterized protein YndB with AHSA1/START domain